MKFYVNLGLLCALFVVIVTAEDDKKSYKGYRVLRVYHHSAREEGFLTALLDDASLNIDLWGEEQSMSAIDIMVPPESMAMVTGELRAQGIRYKIDILDVQDQIDRETVEEEIAAAEVNDIIEKELLNQASRVRRSFRTPQELAAAMFYNNSIVGRYARHAEINEWLQNARYVQPGLVKVISIGRSTENRSLDVIKIGHEDTSKPAIWLDANIHAREWVTGATAVYIIKQLLEHYGRDRRVTSLVNRYNWYILPVANPDGYEYSWTHDRLWRKTRSKTNNPYCQGVDPNRNWGFHWLDCCHLNSSRVCRRLQDRYGCASTDPCSTLYAGPNAFSEPETKAIADFLLQSRDKFHVYVSLHAYTQLFLLPWSFTEELPDDHADLNYVARRATVALTNTHGTLFQIGSPARLLYHAAGGSFDWAKGKAGIKYSFGLELRDTGEFGFLLPKDQIIPSGEEIWAAIQALAETVYHRTPELFNKTRAQW